MIAELGHFALILAFLVALPQVTSPQAWERHFGLEGMP